MKYRIPLIITLLLLSLSLWQCARRGSPTGGPKDTTPPVLLQTTPSSGAVKFKSKKIRLLFDEFVVTKDVRKQLIISPPMKTFPIISPTSYKITTKATPYPILNTSSPPETLSTLYGTKAISPMLSTPNPTTSSLLCSTPTTLNITTP